MFVACASILLTCLRVVDESVSELRAMSFDEYVELGLGLVVYCDTVCTSTWIRVEEVFLEYCSGFLQIAKSGGSDLKQKSCEFIYSDEERIGSLLDLVLLETCGCACVHVYVRDVLKC